MNRNNFTFLINAIEYKKSYQNCRDYISIISVTAKQDPLLWQVLDRDVKHLHKDLVCNGIRAEKVLSMGKKQLETKYDVIRKESSNIIKSWPIYENPDIKNMLLIAGNPK